MARRDREEIRSGGQFREIKRGNMLVSVIEFEAFTTDAAKLFTDEELADLILLLAMTPEIGVVMPGTGGIRKTALATCAQREGKAWWCTGRILLL
jgi:hypothetical protein